MQDHLSTQQLAWILDRSPGTIRDRIKDGEIEAIRIVDGFRIPKAEALRLARDLEALIDELIATNEERLPRAG